MFRKAVVLSLPFVMCLASPGLAQSQLERMEVLSERAGALTNAAMIAQVPELEGRMPAPDWDDAMRVAFTCVLDRYIEAAGSDAVDLMLDQMEAVLADATVETILDGEITQAVDLPAGMTPEEGGAIVNQCGVMQIMMDRMAASGAMEVMIEQ